MSLFDRIRSQGRKRIFLNKSILDQNYRPERMITREKKEEQLGRYFLDFLENPGATYTQVLITGKQGVGKTHLSWIFYEELSKEFEKEHKKKLLLAYVNCYRKTRSLMQIVREMARPIKSTVSTRGLSADEVLNHIADIMEKKDLYMMLVLDDFQYALMFDPHIATFVARLYEQINILTKKRIQTIIVMNDVSILDMYVRDERVKSWKERHIVMEPYKSWELFEILADRREKAFYPGTVPDEVLEEISNLVGIDTHPSYPNAGSARVAIEMLRLAGERAEAMGVDRVNLEDVRYAWAELNKHGDVMVVSELLEDLSDHELLFLYALASLLMNNEGFVRIGRVEEEYRSLCELLGVEPRKHTQIYEYSRRLDDLGVVKRTTSNKGMRGRSTLLSIDYPADLFRNKIAEILRRRGYDI